MSTRVLLWCVLLALAHTPFTITLGIIGFIWAVFHPRHEQNLVIITNQVLDLVVDF